MVIVPGILGSELVDTRTGDLVWGLGPKALATALVTGSLYDRLAQGRLEPRGLLGFTGSFPGLARFEPYTGLVRRLTEACVHPDAVLEFPYDWRQPLAQNATRLANAAHAHLQAWRAHPAATAEARLVFVAHSMGGLLAWHAASLHLATSDVSLVLTLGTPFGGSVRAVRAVGNGDLLPLHAHAAKLRACARRLPALHDLLPSHPSLATAGCCVPPSADDLISYGADPDFVKASFTARAALTAKLAEPHHRPPTLIPFVGTHQPTLQSFTVDNGKLRFRESLDGTDWAGDGTVYQGAAYPAGHRTTVPLPQQHGALASNTVAFASVVSALMQSTVGPPQGDGVGLAVPDAVIAGRPFEIRVTHAARALCTYAPAGARSLGRIPLTRRTNDFGVGELHGRLSIRQPGLYTVSATGGGFGSVSADILVLDESG